MNTARAITITTSFNDCDHKSFTYKTIYVRFIGLYLCKTYKVCHNCHDLIEDHKYWKWK